MGCVTEIVPPFSPMKEVSLPKTSAVIPGDDLKRCTKRSRRVSFQEEAQVLATLPTTTQEEYNEVWYTNDELNSFKDDAKSLCQRLFLENPVTTVNQTVPCCHGGNCIRGMERYISPDRHKHKCLAVRVILKAHERCSSPDHLALIAQKCTFQAKQVAYMAAIRDANTACNIFKADMRLNRLRNPTGSEPSTRLPKRKTLSERQDSGVGCSVSLKKRRVCSPPTANTENVLMTTTP